MSQNHFTLSFPLKSPADAKVHEFRDSIDKRRGGFTPMLFLTRWFGVTASDAELSLGREQSDIKEITERVLMMQANAAAQQRRPLRRGTHAKGICARA